MAGTSRLVLLLCVALAAGCASGNRPLQLVSGTGAIYPPDARTRGVEGYVVVGYDVDVEGRVVNPRVIESVPPDVFDESALQAVSRWRFRAPEKGGEAQPVSGLHSRLNFVLGDGKAYADY